MDAKAELKAANQEYTTCISKEFLGKFLAGEAVSIDNFCVPQRQRMADLDKQVYGDLPF